eukprot:g6585.t1
MARTTGSSGTSARLGGFANPPKRAKNTHHCPFWAGPRPALLPLGADSGLPHKLVHCVHELLELVPLLPPGHELAAQVRGHGGTLQAALALLWPGSVPGPTAGAQWLHQHQAARWTEKAFDQWQPLATAFFGASCGSGLAHAECCPVRDVVQPSGQG